MQRVITKKKKFTWKENVFLPPKNAQLKIQKRTKKKKNDAICPH